MKYPRLPPPTPFHITTFFSSSLQATDPLFPPQRSICHTLPAASCDSLVCTNDARSSETRCSGREKHTRRSSMCVCLYTPVPAGLGRLLGHVQGFAPSANISTNTHSALTVASPCTHKNKCLPAGPQQHTHTHTFLLVNRVYRVHHDSNISGDVRIRANKYPPRAALTASPHGSLSRPLTGAPAIFLHDSLRPSLQPQMVKHCDQLKTSLRIEPVIVSAI